ncbi:MAG: substrate-binding domain-containing protein [Candidatus Bathyarchaeota archaeon]|nr:substrate-binding domain-containing protein [Candidatus Termiticorpusculum sp.]
MTTPKTIIKIAAAASLKNGLDDAITAFKATDPTGYANLCFDVCYAGSYTLANKTVDDCVPYDIYLAASDENDHKGMGKVVDACKVETNVTPNPRNFIANSLVLIKNVPGNTTLTGVTSFETVTSSNISCGHIWIADPDLAPAGEYAKDAFIRTNNWDYVWNKVKPSADDTLGSDVQDTLCKLIADGNKPTPIPAVGVVYRSDYLNCPSIPLCNTFFVNYAPQLTNEKIIYSAAVLTNATGHGVKCVAGQFVNFLATNVAATNAFTVKGFRTLTSIVPKPGDPI